MSPPQPLRSLVSKILLQPCSRDLAQLVAALGAAIQLLPLGLPETFLLANLFWEYFMPKVVMVQDLMSSEMEVLSSWEMGLFGYWFSAVCVSRCLGGILTL